MSEREIELSDLLRNTVTLVLRLSRALPREHPVRVQALDYLVRKRLLPAAAILRDTPAHLQLGSTEAADAIEAGEHLKERT